jgi:hypothetical protein
MVVGHGNGTSDDNVKLALVSTPRTGNTWLRYMLASLYRLQEYAVHTPEELPWPDVADNCIVQLHWHHTPAFRALLARHGFQVVTIARNPLAVLLSVWQFASHEPQTARWLSGEGGDESGIHHLPVTAPEFLAYACGPRARALLSVTPEWWNEPGVLRLRYEDLVQAPEATLAGLASRLEGDHASIGETVSSYTMERLRAQSSAHFWRGEPDLWRTMLPAETVGAIRAAHAGVFTALGYD